ncbi:hypothetical protein [Geobacter sp. SVR]|uniref:hypothetical protein n=1 Tax=Geobacter sp. SVR TaxID=2495594 RepID=UPI00143EF9C3|nr:hypothetical protein [Geobacter sp. SVR]BCS53588.1 hypothetical protein GSVR_18960 [Geobacter sp. SVR]GCF84215.1 hypothetical protein GSbR_08150 [Geobacter sp. SVR]
MGSRVSSSFEIVTDQHQVLYNRFLSSSDQNEKIVLLRRLVNLANVMLFLVSSHQLGSKAGEYL